ncbi:unnamed protein product [Mycena citricolor]|uniref:5-formyltetrahydrofolate cyclo-ligase n=1 Tax=Mycena citricolor TaxID=2018698 RepID=A0AAD2HIR6_9AGAR|nr:unnamed protein product [Mycena citricolor]
MSTSAAALALKADKAILRKDVCTAAQAVRRRGPRTMSLRSIPRRVVENLTRSISAKALTDRILATPSLIDAQSISCYLSMPTGEIDTGLLVRALLRAGKTLYVPKIDRRTDGKMDMLRVYDEDDLSSLPSGVWGIKEPGATRNGSPRANAMDSGLDVILVPALAFDRALCRLGHGKGYYDRFIRAHTEALGRTPTLVGLALEEQLLEPDTIPTGAHDWKMDHIITCGSLVSSRVATGPEDK